MKPYVTEANINKKTEEWMDKVGPYNRSKLKLDRKGSALMVVDMQRFFMDPEGGAYTCGAKAVLPNIRKLIEAFRKEERPVIFTKHVHHPAKIDAGIMEWWWEGMCIEDSFESEISAELKPLPDEKIIKKHRYSAFYNTDLETILRCQKIEDIVICGTMTNMCCESTARDAYYRDHRVFFPADANGAVSEEMHLASLLNLAFGFAVIKRTQDVISELSGG